MMLEAYPDVLTTRDVMKILNITKNLMYELIHTSQISAYKLGKRDWRINKQDLIRYLQKSKR